MTNAFRLAWRHLSFNRLRTAILILCLTLAIVLPLCMQLLVTRFQTRLRDRAASTPLIIGASGSELNLVVNSLYFDSAAPPMITMGAFDYVRDSGLATPIPLHIRYTAKNDYRVVGTNIEYFAFRRSKIRQGTALQRLGDCVLGATVANELDLKPGDTLLSDSENVYDLAGSYPLKMHVVGVLAPSNTPDDRAVFVDIRTAWIIDGIGHGHQNVAKSHDEDVVLDRDEKNKTVTASAAIEQFMEITDENLASFHFHGKPSDFPVTSVIAVPGDKPSGIKLMGRYVSDDSEHTIAEPTEIVEQLLAIVLRIRQFFAVASWLIAVVTGLFLVLVTLLTLRLRQREMRTMFKLGCSRGTIAQLQIAELMIVLAVSLLLASTIAALVQHFGSDLIRRIVF